MNRSRPYDVATLVAALIVLAVITIASLAAIQPPPVRSRDAAVSEFSAVRALAVLKQLAGDNVPHPTGSARNEIVRERIVARLRALGYEPRVESKFVCGIYASCATVTNVVAELPGDRRDAVLLAVHYDSVPAGPGASDDGVAVAATLEIARAMRAMPQPKRSVILLIDDGEEAGLLGASAFVATPDAKRVVAVVNEESRGTSGASLMFETSSGNEAIIRAFARGVKHPVANSLYYAFYKRMPNNTDLTVFKQANLRGLNFAFIGNVGRYHTPEDNFSHVTPATLQHHGDNALGMLRELAWNDAPVESKGDAVYFDFFGRSLVWWPAGLNALLVGLAALALVAAFVLARRRGSVVTKSISIAFAMQLVGLVATFAIAFGVMKVLRAAGITRLPFVAYPVPLEIAFWTIPLIVLPFCGWLFRNRCSREEMTFGSAALYLFGAIAITFIEPSATFVFIPAALALAIALLVAVLVAHPRGFDVAAIVGATVAAIPLFPISLMLYSSLGGPILPAISLTLALVMSPLVAVFAYDRLLGGWRLSIAAFIVAMSVLIVAAFRPPFSLDSPRPLDLQYVESPGGRPQWVTSAAFGPLPPRFNDAAKWRLEALEGLPTYRESNRYFVADAPAVKMAPPRLEVSRSVSAGPGKRRLTIHVVSPRHASVVRLIVSGAKGITDVVIDGQRVGEVFSVVRKAWEQTDAVQLIVQPPPEGVEISFTAPATEPVKMLLMDQSSGLPPQAGDLVRHRPRTSTTRQDGDTTVIMREVTIAP